MPAESDKYRLDLLGSFGLFDSRGRRIEISSKKGQALIALLATAREGTRSRGWLQDMLWGSRAPEQAQASLRRELSNLRRLLNRDEEPLLVADHGRLSLALCRLDVDIHAPSRATGGRTGGAEFLEGIDIAGEEGFEDWLRQQRCAIEALVEEKGLASSAPDVPRPAAEGLVAPVPIGTLARSRPAEPFLDRPLLAVLPFSNLTGDRDNDYLAEGIAEELIEQLSRLRWIPIVARGASFAYSTEAHTLREIGAALNARYIVEGRLRGQGSTLGLGAAMSEVPSGRMLWTRRMEFPRGSSAAELEPLLTEIVGALSTEIDDAEMTRAASRPQSDLNVNDLIWRARWHDSQYTTEDGRIAEQLLGEALRKEPRSPEAIIQFAFFHQRQIWLHRGDKDAIVDLRKLAQRAIAADYRDGRGYMIAGIAEVWLRNSDAAIALLEQAIELNPSLAYAHSQLGAAHYLRGDPETAIGILTQALRLNMGAQYSYYVLAEIAMAHAMLGQWDQAIEIADQSIIRRTAYWYAHVVKIHALLGRGDLAAAKRAHAVLLANKPSFEPGFVDWVPFVDPKWPERLKQSLLIVEGGNVEMLRPRLTKR